MTHSAILDVLIWACPVVMLASIIARIVRFARKNPRLPELSLESILSAEETVERRLRSLRINARRVYVRDIGPALFLIATLFVVCAVYFAASQPGNTLLSQLSNAAFWLIFALSVAAVYFFQTWLSYRAARRIILAGG
jgi:type III secretory pathway component EscS